MMRKGGGIHTYIQTYMHTYIHACIHTYEKARHTILTVIVADTGTSCRFITGGSDVNDVNVDGLMGDIETTAGVSPATDVADA